MSLLTSGRHRRFSDASALAAGLLAFCVPASVCADVCAKPRLWALISEYVRPDTGEEALYPQLARMERRDFAAAVRALRSRRPPVIGLPIIERVSYRLAATRDLGAALQTRLELADLEPGYLQSIADDLGQMRVPRGKRLTEVKDRLAKEAVGYLAQGHLTYEELLKLSQEFSAVANFLDPEGWKRGPLRILRYGEEELDGLSSFQASWEREVIGHPMDRTRDLLGQGLVSVPFRLTKSPEEIAAAGTRSVPVQVVAKTTSADGEKKPPWEYAWFHDHEIHGNLLAKSQPKRLRSAAPKHLRRSQEKIIPIEQEIRRLAEERPDLPLIRELLYGSGHEQGDAHSWREIGKNSLIRLLRDPDHGLEWAVVFETLEKAGHRQWPKALASRHPEVFLLLRRLGLEQEADSRLRTVFLAVVTELLQLEPDYPDGFRKIHASDLHRNLRLGLHTNEHAKPLLRSLLERLEERVSPAELED